MSLKAVLFDLDGVLIDTEGIYTEFWANIDRKYPTGVENFALVIKGTTLSDILERYFPASEIQMEIRRTLKEFEEEMPYVFFDGAEDLLRLLKTRHISTAIVTSSNRAKMGKVYGRLPILGEMIDTLVTDEDVTESKPDPEGYLLAAGRLGAESGEFAVVEDSMHGLEAGRRSGGYVVGIATTNPREKVVERADYVGDTVADIAEYLLSL